jgi:hypothetical protein
MKTSAYLLDERAYRHVVSPAARWVCALLSAVPAHAVGDRLSDGVCSLLELHGLGREIWQGVDAVDYVRSLRDEWDR